MLIIFFVCATNFKPQICGSELLSRWVAYAEAYFEGRRWFRRWHRSDVVVSRSSTDVSSSARICRRICSLSQCIAEPGPVCQGPRMRSEVQCCRIRLLVVAPQLGHSAHVLTRQSNRECRKVSSFCRTVRFWLLAPVVQAWVFKSDDNPRC